MQQQINWHYVNKEGLPVKNQIYLIACVNKYNLERTIRCDKWNNLSFQLIDTSTVYAWSPLPPPPVNQ
jgi:hypothetical protein